MPGSIETWASWWRNAQTMWDIALAAPQVISHRTARMALAGHSPSARDRTEFTRMGLEKLEAAGEAALAVGMGLLQAQQAALLALMQAWWKPQAWVDSGPWLRAMPGVTAAGLKPVHQRVTSNAKRLARVALQPAVTPAIAPLLKPPAVRRKKAAASAVRKRPHGG